VQSYPFRPSKLKVDRAKRHIRDLTREISGFLDRKPYRVVIEPQFDGAIGPVIRVREAIPCDFPLIVGDAVHNLRASLDLLACALVEMNAKSTKNVYFPFAEDGKHLELVIKQRNVDRAAPDVVDIIRSLKPYKRGNDALRAIHDMDIMDKHKLIIPVVYFAGFSHRIGGMMFEDCRIGPIEDGTRSIQFSPIRDIKIGDELDSRFVITFGEGTYFSDQPMLETLYQLAELVGGIIEIFSMHCAR
jgi:hypothetical protein